MKCPRCPAQIEYEGEAHKCTSPAPSGGDPLSIRTAEKLIRMATVYGQGADPGQIRERLGVDPAQARELLEKYLKTYPELARSFRRKTMDEILGHVVGIDLEDETIAFDTEGTLSMGGLGAKGFLKTTEEFAEHFGADTEKEHFPMPEAPGPGIRKEPVEETPKQWIVMRTDLKMRKGKMIAQGAHASMRVLLDRGVFSQLHAEPQMGPAGMEDSFDRVLREVREEAPPLLTVTLTLMMQKWVLGVFTKVCLRVESEEELDSIYQRAVEVGLPAALIVDAGKTEFKGVPTKTCCAIGPCLPSQVKDIVGHLKLL